MNEVGYISIAVIIFFLTSGILIRRIKKYHVADDIHRLHYCKTYYGER